jgi:hypothetical protein
MKKQAASLQAQDDLLEQIKGRLVQQALEAKMLFNEDIKTHKVTDTPTPNDEWLGGEFRTTGQLLPRVISRRRRYMEQEGNYRAANAALLEANMQVTELVAAVRDRGHGDLAERLEILFPESVTAASDLDEILADEDSFDEIGADFDELVADLDELEAIYVQGPAVEEVDVIEEEPAPNPMMEDDEEPAPDMEDVEEEDSEDCLECGPMADIDEMLAGLEFDTDELMAEIDDIDADFDEDGEDSEVDADEDAEALADAELDELLAEIDDSDVEIDADIDKLDELLAEIDAEDIDAEDIDAEEDSIDEMLADLDDEEIDADFDFEDDEVDADFDFEDDEVDADKDETSELDSIMAELDNEVDADIDIDELVADLDKEDKKLKLDSEFDELIAQLNEDSADSNFPF